MHKKTITLFFLFTIGSLFSQVDSLKQFAKTTKQDTAKAEAYIQVAKAYYNNEGLLDSSLHYYDKAVILLKKYNSSSRLAKALNGKALMYREKGLYTEALDNCLQALSIAESVKDTNQITAAYNGIAIVNQIQKDYDKAFEYYKKCEAIHLKRNSTTGLAGTYNNLGLLFSEKRDPAKSLDYFQKALLYNEENDNKRGIATVNENIGLHYLEYDKNADEALKHFYKSVALWRGMKDVNSVAITLDYIVLAMLEKKDYKKCLDTANLSLKLAKEAGSIFSIKQAHEKLYMIYEKLNNIPEAHTHYKQFIALRDSLKNDDQSREITQMQLTYEFDKQKEVEALKQEIKQKELSEEIDKQKNIILYFLILLILVLIFCILIWRSYRINKKAREKIASQNVLLEEQNKNIVDSIKYAKHIQEAILPPNELMNALLPQHFTLYKPKDIVSGDFYWIMEKQGKIYLAVVDCTGHGVPGAFISILGRNGLTEAMNNLNNPTAGEILDFLNKYVNGLLNQSEEHAIIRDGMDITLCILDKAKNTLQYSGANNPLWIIGADNNTAAVAEDIVLFGKNGIEYKANKQPIGNFINEVATPFTFVEIPFKKNDMLYLFTDGYSDQFGGPQKKKFKRSKLKELFLSVSTLELAAQKEVIEKTFIDWKGNIEQIDDVCIIGVRL